MATASTTTNAVKTLAPEDVRVGDYVSILSRTYQWPSFLWCEALTPQSEAVAVRFLPVEAVGMPWKVKAICLPFIAVRTVDGKMKTLDVRQCLLARLDDQYAKVIWKSRRKSKRKK